MKCPYCDHVLPSRATICPNCGATVTRPVDQQGYQPTWNEKHRWLISFLSMLLAFLLAVAAITLIYNFVRGYQLKRDYTRGARTPQVAAITMADQRPGHSILFYGDDGDSLFIPELNTTYRFADGIARIAIADGVWFDENTIEEVDTAVVTLSPILMKKGCETVELPQVTLEIAPPKSPLTISEPKEASTTVYSKVMPLTFNVVPGSTVLINGADASNEVDRFGDITYYVDVLPIGDNNYSILVKTPDHQETRADVIYHREQLAIDIALNDSIPERTTSNTLKITGTTLPDANIVVDSKHVDGSLIMNHETGEFSFISTFNLVGKNTIRFHAERPTGELDSKGNAKMETAYITVDTQYVPILDTYGGLAWAMDYKALRLNYEQLVGRVFLCKGKIIEVYTEDNIQYLVMNVAPEGEKEQLVVLQNESAVTQPDKVTVYRAYSDVIGRTYYNSEYCPLLICRYMLYAE